MESRDITSLDRQSKTDLIYIIIREVSLILVQNLPRDYFIVSSKLIIFESLKRPKKIYCLNIKGKYPKSLTVLIFNSLLILYFSLMNYY
jgi:hypothetical protein